MSVVMSKKGRVGYVALANPPVNAMGQALRQGLLDAVDWAEREALERVILFSRGKVFAAGGDAREFDGPLLEPHLPDVLSRIEVSPVPWIAVAQGAALGGGLELMMACRYRIATPGTVLGLPEVNLGVVPGAGGTVRLPRLIGLDKALELIPLGASLTAEQGKDLGLIDEVDDDPLYFAELTNPEWLGMKVPVCELNAGQATPDAWKQAEENIVKRMPRQEAPRVAIELLRATQDLSFEAASAKARDAFVGLRSAEQSKALRHVFFAERAARLPKALKEVARPEVKSAVVVGGGTMGVGIAYSLLLAGIHVRLVEADEQALSRATANLEGLIASGIKRRLLTEAKAQGMRQALLLTTSYDAACADADLAIEAVFEDFEVKMVVLKALENTLPPQAVIASNTSYLDVNALAAGLQEPARLLGLHFFAPAHIMKRLEIIRAETSSPSALALGFDLAKRLDKVPIVAGVCDGFIGNRILARFREAADTVLMDGSTPWDIDEALVDFGYPMGPYEAQDLSGLDIAYANRRRQDATRDPKRRYIPIADRMIELGKLGKKVGAGWYRYPGGNGKVEDPIVADLAIEEAYFAKVERQDFSPEEIRRRLLLALINEACNILDEGIATAASDIDLVTVFGYGFPRWRGGLMYYADHLGLQAIADQLAALAQEDPIAWQPSPLIAKLLARGESLASFRPDVADN